MLNSTNHIGRIITELKLKTTESGGKVLKFRIACERDYAKLGEERKSDIFSCVAYNQDANFICNNFDKGAMIGITGKLESYSHPSADGKQYASVYIRVVSSSFTGERREKELSLFEG